MASLAGLWAVRMDSYGQVWSGTQSTPTRGAWRKLPAELEPQAQYDALMAQGSALKLTQCRKLLSAWWRQLLRLRQSSQLRPP